MPLYIEATGLGGKRVKNLWEFAGTFFSGGPPPKERDLVEGGVL